MTPGALKGFTCFPKIPKELRLRIWSLASASMSPKIFWVASYPEADHKGELGDTYDEKVSHRIFADGAYSTPSLLMVCREARNEVFKDFAIWGVSLPEPPHHPILGNAFIHKKLDTVYYKALCDFEWLERLSQNQNPPKPINPYRAMSEHLFRDMLRAARIPLQRRLLPHEEPRDIEGKFENEFEDRFEDPFDFNVRVRRLRKRKDLDEIQLRSVEFRQLEQQFEGIENLAMSWENFHNLFRFGRVDWFVFLLPSVKVFTVVYTLRADDVDCLEWKVYTPPQFLDFKAGTKRYTNAKKMEWWTKKIFDMFAKEHPKMKVPELLFKQIRTPTTDDNNAPDDLLFEHDFEADYYSHEGYPLHGDLPDVQ
jgi:2EXR family